MLSWLIGGGLKEMSGWVGDDSKIVPFVALKTATLFGLSEFAVARNAS